jgi:hypothetical protein
MGQSKTSQIVEKKFNPGMINLEVVRRNDRSICSICGKSKDPRKPVCPDCIKTYGLEAVSAVKEAFGVSAQVIGRRPDNGNGAVVPLLSSFKQNRNVHNPHDKNEGRERHQKSFRKTDSSKVVRAYLLEATETDKTAAPGQPPPPAKRFHGNLAKLPANIAEMLVKECREVIGQITPDTNICLPHLTTVLRLFHAGCGFPAIIAALPDAAVIALKEHKAAEEAAKAELIAKAERDKQDMALAENQALLAARCRELAEKALPRLPLEAVDPAALADKILFSNENTALPRQLLISQLALQLARVRDAVNGGFMSQRVKHAVNAFLNAHPQENCSKTGELAKKINDQHIADPLPLGELEAVLEERIKIHAAQRRRGMEQYMTATVATA